MILRHELEHKLPNLPSSSAKACRESQDRYASPNGSGSSFAIKQLVCERWLA